MCQYGRRVVTVKASGSVSSKYLFPFKVLKYIYYINPSVPFILYFCTVYCVGRGCIAVCWLLNISAFLTINHFNVVMPTGPSALSLFRFHLFPFSPETPDSRIEMFVRISIP